MHGQRTSRRTLTQSVISDKTLNCSPLRGVAASRPAQAPRLCRAENQHPLGVAPPPTPTPSPTPGPGRQPPLRAPGRLLRVGQIHKPRNRHVPSPARTLCKHRRRSHRRSGRWWLSRSGNETRKLSSCKGRYTARDSAFTFIRSFLRVPEWEARSTGSRPNTR